MEPRVICQSFPQLHPLALSAAMTTCSMVLAIGLLPLLLYIYSGGLCEGDLGGKVPYKGTITSMVLMLIPCAIGIILSEKKPQYTGFITKAGMVMLLLSSAAIIVLSVANMGSCIMVIFSPSLLGSSAVMPLTGFLLGYAVSAAFKLDDRCRWTVCTDTGCQNVQLCSAILKVAFAPEIIGPLYFFPLLCLLLQLGEGFLLILVFQIHYRIKQANEAAKVICASVDTISAQDTKSVSRHCRNSGKPGKQYMDSAAATLPTLRAPPSAASSQVSGHYVRLIYTLITHQPWSNLHPHRYSTKTLLQTKPGSVSPERRLSVTSTSL